jgi:hypothetical protein
MMQKLISLLQGRVERTVFTQFYLKENPMELADKTISLVGDLENNLLSIKLRENFAYLFVVSSLKFCSYSKLLLLKM